MIVDGVSSNDKKAWLLYYFCYSTRVILWLFQVHRARDEADVPWLQDRVPPGTRKSIELFIEDQTFSPSYNLVPSVPLPPLSREQLISVSQSSFVSLVELTGERGGKAVGEEPNHMPAKKPGPLKNHSKLWSWWIQWSLAYFLTDFCSDLLRCIDENASVTSCCVKFHSMASKDVSI